VGREQEVRADKQKRIQERFDRLKAFLDERSRRLWAANEAIAFGQGGIRAVAEALGMSPKTVMDGRRELKGARGDERKTLAVGRQRRAGGGRKRLIEDQPEVVKAIEAIVAPATRGDPMTPLKWTSKSLSKIRAELKHQGWSASEKTVSRILSEDLKYSLYKG
jgi:transposase